MEDLDPVSALGCGNLRDWTTGLITVGALFTLDFPPVVVGFECPRRVLAPMIVWPSWMVHPYVSPGLAPLPGKWDYQTLGDLWVDSFDL